MAKVKAPRNILGQNKKKKRNTHGDTIIIIIIIKGGFAPKLYLRESIVEMGAICIFSWVHGWFCRRFKEQDVFAASGLADYIILPVFVELRLSCAFDDAGRAHESQTYVRTSRKID